MRRLSSTLRRSLPPLAPCGPVASQKASCGAATASDGTRCTHGTHRRDSTGDDNDDGGRATRAEHIRKTERRMRWLRALVVPAFTIYGLVILRPTEGHFLRYLAERRHLDPSFNAWFPPLTRSDGDGDGDRAGQGKRKDKESQTARRGPAAGTGSGVESKPVDRDWLRRRLRVESKEDEERIARHRLLFSRTHNYSAAAGSSDGHAPVVVKSREQRQRELEEQREHPPMHLLSDQLNAIAALSHRYHEESAASLSAAQPPPPPPIEVRFTDRALFATASVVLHGPAGEPVNTMRFIGACGMMWWQLA